MSTVLTFFVKKPIFSEERELSLKTKFSILREELIYVFHGEPRFEEHLQDSLPLTIFEVEIDLSRIRKEIKDIISISCSGYGDYEELITDTDTELRWHLLEAPWYVHAVVFSQQALSLIKKLK